MATIKDEIELKKALDNLGIPYEGLDIFKAESIDEQQEKVAEEEEEIEGKEKDLEKKEDAEFIAKACNAYGDLLAALEFIVNDIPSPGENAELTAAGYNMACAAIAHSWFHITRSHNASVTGC